MVMFHSYVSLPEGTSLSSDDFASPLTPLLPHVDHIDSPPDGGLDRTFGTPEIRVSPGRRLGFSQQIISG
jgi:hypothetical protein